MNNKKLNLGSGFDYREGWINLDIDPETKPDIVADLQQPLPFTGNSIDEIDLQDVVEHLTKEQAQTLLEECYRVLKPGGSIRVRVPHVLTIINHFADDPGVMMEFLYGSTDQNGVWGAHKHGYTSELLMARLKQTGFTDISVAEIETNLEATATKAKLNQQLHVLVIQQSPDWGGAEEWMALLVDQLVTNHHQVTGVTNLSSLRERFRSSGASVIDLPYVLDIIGNWKGLLKSALYFFPSLVWYSRLLFKAKRDGVSVIVMSGFSEKLLVSWLSLLFNIPVVWYEYGPLELVFKRNFRLPKILYRLSKFIPKRVITISRNTRNHLIPHTRISLSKLRLVYPGVTMPSVIKPRKNAFIVGSLSRLAPEKGQRTLLEAWKMVSKELPNARLKIAGRGDEVDTLMALAQKLKILDSVEFLGFVKNKADFYNGIDVFVFPSTWEMEGFGLVAAEAMSFAKPVVGFNAGPLPEIVLPSCGELAEPYSPNSLAKSIITLLRQPEVLTVKGEMARKRAESRFNLINNADQVIKELEYVVRENHS